MKLHELEPDDGEVVTQASSRFALWLSVGLLLAGLVFCGLTYWQFSREVAFVKEAKTAPAIIVDFVEDTREIGKDDTVYRAVLQFTADDGQTYRVRGSTGYSAGVQKLGQATEVLYVSGKPQEADEKGTLGNFASLVLGILAVIFVSLGSLGIFLSLRRAS